METQLKVKPKCGKCGSNSAVFEYRENLRDIEKLMIDVFDSYTVYVCNQCGQMWIQGVFILRDRR